MRPLPAFWNPAEGRWIVTSPFALMPHQLHAIARYLLPIQRQRYVGLRPGYDRDELARAIRALEAGKIECGLADRGAGVVPFQSTQGTGKVISLGAA